MSQPLAYAGAAVDPARLRDTIARHDRHTLPRLDHLWTYYRNPILRGDGSTDAPYRQGQEDGLPERLRGKPRSSRHLADDRAGRREVVIENDIGWRVQTMVDFMFSKPVAVLSTAGDAPLRARIESVLDRALEASGGITMLQDMALLGHVFGFVDLVIRPGDGIDPPRVEVVDPRRSIPLVNPDDYRILDAYAVRTLRAPATPAERSSAWWSLRVQPTEPSPGEEVLELFTPGRRQLFVRGRLVLDERARWTGDRLPIVHIQNISQPFEYAGQSDVEPLVPVQDELNTRLSDRANRVTMQSFKMFLAKGIDGFTNLAVGPGQLWSTDNTDATVETFGGDASSPSEDAHILEVREAMDKISGVPPLAGGVIRAKIGNLSSANALKITLMGTLAKTARKRVTYGRGLADAAALILASLDHTADLRTRPGDRGIRLEWPDPLPKDDREELAAAEAKARLGVPRERILAELGYSPTDPGVQ
jgi:hypothetical protein